MPNAPTETTAFAASTATSSHGRLIEVLDALVRRVESEAWGVRELAGALGESRSTVNRILVTLLDRDFAVEDGVGKYRAGPRLTVLMHALSQHSALLTTARQHLDELARTTRQTALLSVYAPYLNGYYVLHCGQAPATLSFRPRRGHPFPLGFGDIGRAFEEHLRAHASLEGASPCQATLEPSRNISEAEFPPAVAMVVKQVLPGLLVLVSLHDLEDTEAKAQGSARAALEEIADRLSKAPDVADRIDRQERCEGDNALVARLEALLLLVCAGPNGCTCGSGLAAHLHCNAATAKKIIGSAASERLIHLDGMTLYPGARLYQWAALLGNEAYAPATLCKAIIDALVKETGETIAYLSFDPSTSKAQFHEVVRGWRPIQYTLDTGVDVPLYAGGAGKAVLAYLPSAFAERLTLKKLTDTTLTSHVQLQADLQAIRARGWSVGDGERVMGAFGIGVPFFIDGQVAGSISATIPQYRKEDCDVPALVEHMKRAAARIGRLLSLRTGQAVP